MTPSAATIVAGVAGSPIGHSLSPVLHNTWIKASNLDAIYLAFEPRDFRAFAHGLRGGAMRGLNITAPFKAQALELADSVSRRAVSAGAANLLIFEEDGDIHADNTDGEGLLAALAEQAKGFDPSSGPAVILGAGGAAQGAAAALIQAGTPLIRVVNRSPERALALAASFPRFVEAVSPDRIAAALDSAHLVVNAAPTTPEFPLDLVADTTVIMDMVYRPLQTAFLARAQARGLRVVDGLAMLIGQARPSFEALFGTPAPDLDIRAVALGAMGPST